MPGPPPPRHPVTSAAAIGRFHWLVISRPRFGKRCLRLFRTMMRTYVLPQFTAARRERIALDMELDEAVPFDESWLPCYLGFVRLWQGALGWMHLRFGNRALPEMEGFIDGLEALFLEAAKIFSARDSTLAGRPGPRLSPASLLVHFFDRNSFCFPSLHVMIVRFTHLRLAAAVERVCGEGACAAELGFLEERALRITESIVHVKQHSVCDIPAALFLLHSLGGRDGLPAGDREADLDFLERLFRQEEHGSRGRHLRDFMRGVYERLHTARAGAEGAPEVLLGFLERYREEVASLLRGARKRAA